MATNLKKTPEEKVEKKPGRQERERIPLDLKWVAMGLAMMAITMGSVIVGIYLAPNKIIHHETTNTQFVEVLVKDGPAIPLMMAQVANLNGGGYLKFSCVLKYAENEKYFKKEKVEEHGGGKPVNPLEEFDAMMKDSVLTSIGKQAGSDLLTPAGKDHLKSVIKKSINNEFKEMAKKAGEGDPRAFPLILHVYFTEFAVSGVR